eukprot:CAMPEP_0116854352 /NCGR_PEP_ID=MMETSP0418-20121206/18539_1 /TAXON_ID=1158023 /ORGANISM="Astrosyne radiata, Strain 13vi08-1A" /LENGTH=188 /DNA_ID=CAMNT_0004487093 /DNA_START=127 /DNA_END=693 /DNA_ORIENTATION=-
MDLSSFDLGESATGLSVLKDTPTTANSLLDSALKNEDQEMKTPPLMESVLKKKRKREDLTSLHLAECTGGLSALNEKSGPPEGKGPLTPSAFSRIHFSSPPDTPSQFSAGGLLLNGSMDAMDVCDFAISDRQALEPQLDSHPEYQPEWAEAVSTLSTMSGNSPTNKGPSKPPSFYESVVKGHKRQKIT